MPGRETLYEAALGAARPLLRLAAPLHPKLARGIAGRRGAVAALEAWAAASREPARPLVWVHAPSVGEGLMAQAIIAALRDHRPEIQIAFTHFSPSAERLAARIGADVNAYLPWDLSGEMRRSIAALRPEVVAFIRTEIWPVLTHQAAMTGARLALVNAVLSEGSSRLRPLSRLLLGPAYRRLDAVGAVAEDDAARFSSLGVAPTRVRITGDARFDQVWARVESLRPRHRIREQTGPAAAECAKPPPDGGPDAQLAAPAVVQRLADPAVTTVVAGSSWPADEERLVPAFARARLDEPFRLIIAPHEPDDRHLAGLERRLDKHGLQHARLGRLEREGGLPPQVVVIDRVGVLADSYAVADVAYVGGGFHAAGLHSVVEPAALAIPVLFGPRHGNAREAAELEGAGGGFLVHDGDSLTQRLLELARDGDRRRRAGNAAVAYVRSRLGGASGNAGLVLELLDGAAERRAANVAD